MKKVLFTSHRANFAKFNRSFMRWFKENGYEVHYASDGEEEVLDCDKHFNVCFNRSPYSLDNIKAYKELKKIINKENYDIIHCHTPMGGVVTRLAAKDARRRGAKVLYTAHGFHFYKGAPLLNWLLFYPVEKYLSKYTDCIITINKEDYNLAKTKFRAGKVEKINGVGVDLDRFKPVSSKEKLELRNQYGFNENDFILIYIAEFIDRKNHKFIINSLINIKKLIPNLRILFVGNGINLEKCIDLVKKNGLDNIVAFLGYRKDVHKWCQLSDIVISASIQEGLGLNVIEGMACGLPAVASKIRGHNEIITTGINYMYDVDNKEQFKNAIIDLYNDENKRISMGRQNVIDVERFSLENAIKNMSDIYHEYI